MLPPWPLARRSRVVGLERQPSAGRCTGRGTRLARQCQCASEVAFSAPLAVRARKVARWRAGDVEQPVEIVSKV